MKKPCTEFTFGLRNLYALQHHVNYSYVTTPLFAVNKIVGFLFITCIRRKYVYWIICCDVYPSCNAGRINMNGYISLSIFNLRRRQRFAFDTVS